MRLWHFEGDHHIQWIHKLQFVYSLPYRNIDCQIHLVYSLQKCLNYLKKIQSLLLSFRDVVPFRMEYVLELAKAVHLSSGTNGVAEG